MSFAMVLVIGFLLLVSLVSSFVLQEITRSMDQTYILQAGHQIVSFAMVTLLFALIFKVLPDAQIHWHDVWVGAAVSAVLFGVGKLLFGVYLGHSTIGSSYGAAGSLVIVVLWTYYSSAILLFGAEVTQVQARLLGEHIEPTKAAVHISEHDRLQQGLPRLDELKLADERLAELESKQKAAEETRHHRPANRKWRKAGTALAAFAMGYLLSTGRHRRL